MNKFCGLLLLCVQFHWSVSALTAIHVNPVDRINKVVVDTLQTCYKDEKTIVVHAESDEWTIRALANSETFAIILYKDSSTIARHIDQYKEMPIFLMTANSSEQFQERLVALKRSPWWNVMAPFFVLDTSNSHCELAKSIHDRTWAMSIVNSLFVCLNLQQEPMFHMYNPYTNRAPSQWTQLEMMEKKVSSRWTTYERQYIQGQMCNGLKYDKTKFLDGARVMVPSKEDFVNIPYAPNKLLPVNNIMGWIMNHTPLYYPVRMDFLLADMIQSTLNVTIMCDFHENHKQLKNGRNDLALFFKYDPSILQAGIELTYPIGVMKFKVVTYKGHYTSMENIWNYYGAATGVSTIVSIVLIYGALVMLLGRPRQYGFVAVELLRLLLNISMETPMNNRPQKIFFMMIFFYFLALHTEIDGQIASWLTEPVSQKFIESWEDLYDERTRAIYVGKYSKLALEGSSLNEKVMLMDLARNACGKLVAKNYSVACVDSEVWLEYMSFGRDDIHLMQKSIESNYVSYATRLNWPLKERLDIFLMKLEQFGINDWLEREQRRHMLIELRITKSTEPQTINKGFKVTLANFMPVMYIWAFGMTCAIISFVIELIIGRRRFVKVVEVMTLDDEFVEPTESTVQDISAVPSCSFHNSTHRSILKSVVCHQHQQEDDTEF